MELKERGLFSTSMVLEHIVNIQHSFSSNLQKKVMKFLLLTRGVLAIAEVKEDCTKVLKFFMGISFCS